MRRNKLTDLMGLLLWLVVAVACGESYWSPFVGEAVHPDDVEPVAVPAPRVIVRKPVWRAPETVRPLWRPSSRVREGWRDHRVRGRTGDGPAWQRRHQAERVQQAKRHAKRLQEKLEHLVG